MRLLEAILDANNRAVDGDNKAGLHVAEFQDQLPIIALTCIDPRLNPLLPEVLGIPEEYFIWLRNAGNIITSPLSSTMRSLSLACAIKGGKEIVIIGHTDCQVGKVGTLELLERFQKLGIGRQLLPDNLNEFFGTFSSERQNVIKATGLVRQSPLISPQVPVHGLMVDLETGKLESLVNGYNTLGTDMVSKWNKTIDAASQTVQAMGELTDFQTGNITFGETKIGEAIASATQWMEDKLKHAVISPHEQHPHPNPPSHPPAPPPHVPPTFNVAPPPKPPGKPPLSLRPRIHRH